MALSDSQVRALKATDRRQKKSCGSSSGLYVVVEPISKGGGKSFIGITRFPPRSPKNGGKWIEVRIGPYGKGPGKWSLKQASDEWDLIKTWSRENGKDPRDRKREAKDALVEQATLTTFEQACEAYLTSWSGANDKGKKEYRNILDSGTVHQSASFSHSVAISCKGITDTRASPCNPKALHQMHFTISKIINWRQFVSGVD